MREAGGTAAALGLFEGTGVFSSAETYIVARSVIIQLECKIVVWFIHSVLDLPEITHRPIVPPHFSVFYFSSTPRPCIKHYQVYRFSEGSWWYSCCTWTFGEYWHLQTNRNVKHWLYALSTSSVSLSHHAAHTFSHIHRLHADMRQIFKPPTCIAFSSSLWTFTLLPMTGTSSFSSSF